MQLVPAMRGPMKSSALQDAIAVATDSFFLAGIMPYG